MFNRTPKILQSLLYISFLSYFDLGNACDRYLFKLFLLALKNFEGFAMLYSTKITLWIEDSRLIIYPTLF